ncbi:speckle-type POZ protein-like isoform X1 [Microplitis mediator]|uniref:speckle-type POZ protein-like isoform X1 n=1 Tax=Microplitis mediator TaxID=375433 RepID=UPI0025554C95|nr:speckle-type POZ protein-like isoform X1 [Microplitis mediator]
MTGGYTKIEERNIIYQWKIDRVNIYLDRIRLTCGDFTIVSPEFSAGSKSEDKWCIKAGFSYDNEERLIDLTFNLHLLNCNEPMHTKYSAFVWNEKQGKLFNKDYNSLSNKNDDTEILYLTEYRLQRKKDGCLFNNCLTVCLDLTVYDTVTISKELDLNITKHPMAHDFTKLFYFGIGSDIIINVGDINFEAHKSILIARCPVLAAIFSNEMGEMKESKISIPDISPAVFHKVLEYIYTDEVTGLDDITEGLLEAADKYQLQSLKSICEEALSETLDLENAFDLMVLANSYKATHLLEFTTNFLVLNMKNVNDNPDFKDFEKSHPSLALELVKKYSFPNKSEKAIVSDPTAK